MYAQTVICRSFITLVCCCSASLLSSCSATAPIKQPQEFLGTSASPSKVFMDRDDERTSKAFHHFIVGELDFDNKDYVGAEKHFSQASRLIDRPAPTLHLQLAELHLRAGKLQKALAESERALSEAPKDLEVRLMHAGILEALKQDTKAQHEYEFIISEQLKEITPYLLLGSLYSKRKDFNRMVEVLQKLVANLPDEFMAHYYLGRAYEMASKLDEAEKCYRKSLELQPVNVEVGIDLARVKLKQNDPEGAKAALQVILEKDPQHVEARRLLSQLMIGQGAYGEALEHLKVLEKVESDPSDTLLKIALLEIEKKDFDAAIRELNLLIAKNPNHAAARYYLASIFAGQGKDKEAIEELLKIKKTDDLYVRSRTFAAMVSKEQHNLADAEKYAREALSADENNIEVQYFLIGILKDAGKIKQALKLIEAALSKPDLSEKLLFGFGILYHDLKMEDKAVEVMERIVKLNPNSPEALNYIAYDLAEQGRDLDRAEQLVAQALKAKPDESNYMDTHGWILFKMERFPEALKVLEMASKKAGNDAVISGHYGDVLVKAGKHEEAKAVYRKALEKALHSENQDEKDVAENLKKKLLDLGVKEADLPDK